MNRLFRLGCCVATPAALEILLDNGVQAMTLLLRHALCDWGDLDADDLAANEQALVDGGRLLSAYDLPRGRLWVITEADRSATTILRPEEY
ncbi:MAG: hypothetical protein K9M02_16945 [Thiohalocapsa sp.]|jgi:hypothetical protein|nr:hypothetical protein [Thiohalocapsa sp.]